MYTAFPLRCYQEDYSPFVDCLLAGTTQTWKTDRIKRGAQNRLERCRSQRKVVRVPKSRLCEVYPPKFTRNIIDTVV